MRHIRPQKKMCDLRKVLVVRPLSVCAIQLAVEVPLAGVIAGQYVLHETRTSLLVHHERGFGVQGEALAVFPGRYLDDARHIRIVFGAGIGNHLYFLDGIRL